MFIKGLLKDFVYFLLDKLLPFKANQAVILMYHSIGHQGEFFQATVQEFAKHMDYLAKNKFNVIGLSKLSADLSQGAGLPKKTVAITFDDGYLDNYSLAWPILKEHCFPAIIFVNTAELGQTRMARGGHRLPLMSDKEILEMAKNGLVEFGSHCHHHVKLVNLAEPEMTEEFKQSKKALQDLLGKKPEILAYPSGRYNDSVKATAKKYFTTAVTVRPGVVKPGDDLLALKRNSVDRSVSFTQFKGLIKFGKL